MSRWFEFFLIEHTVLVWAPLAVCVGAAWLVWRWQKGRASPGRIVRIRAWLWLLAVVVIFAALGVLVVELGLNDDLAWLARERPWSVAAGVAVLGAGVALWGVCVHAWRGESRQARGCRRCRYDMVSIPGTLTCPECGWTARNESQLRPVNVRRWALWAAGLVWAAALLTPAAVCVARFGPAGLAPTGTLLSWAAHSSDAPQAVYKELLRRATDQAPGLHGAVQPRAEQLAEVLLSGRGSSSEVYVELLRGCVLTEAVQRRAVEQASSPDLVRRVAAMEVLQCAANPIDIPAASTITWSTDTIPAVAIAARHADLCRGISAHNALRVEISDAQARHLLGVLCESQSPFVAFGSDHPAQPWIDHRDREVALRARCLVARHKYLSNQRDENPLRTMVTLRSAMKEAGLSEPAWAGVGWWLYEGRVTREELHQLLRDQEVNVRGAAAAQLRPSECGLMRRSGMSAAGSMPWLLEELRSAHGDEADPFARGQLEQTIAELQAARARP